MSADPERASDHLAHNLRQLRAARGLTQQQLSDAASVPRATLATVESGGGNPTLAVLVKLAAALRVTLEELVAPPRASARLYRRDELERDLRGPVEVRKLLPDPLPGLALERLALPVGARLVGTPHTPGTREYLACERGDLELVCSGARYPLAAGDVVVFRGDQKHLYRNVGDVDAVAYSVVVIAPPHG